MSINKKSNRIMRSNHHHHHMSLLLSTAEHRPPQLISNVTGSMPLTAVLSRSSVHLAGGCPTLRFSAIIIDPQTLTYYPRKF